MNASIVSDKRRARASRQETFVTESKVEGRNEARNGDEVETLQERVINRLSRRRCLCFIFSFIDYSMSLRLFC